MCLLLTPRPLLSSNITTTTTQQYLYTRVDIYEHMFISINSESLTTGNHSHHKLPKNLWIVGLHLILRNADISTENYYLGCTLIDSDVENDSDLKPAILDVALSEKYIDTENKSGLHTIAKFVDKFERPQFIKDPQLVFEVVGATQQVSVVLETK